MLEAMLWRAEISFSTHNRRYRIDIYRVRSGLYKWRFTSKIVLTLPLACGSSPWRASRFHEQSYLTEGQDLPSFRRIFYIYPQIIYYDHLNYANLRNFGWIFNQDMPLNLFLQKCIITRELRFLIFMLLWTYLWLGNVLAIAHLETSFWAVASPICWTSIWANAPNESRANLVKPSRQEQRRSALVNAVLQK